MNKQKLSTKAYLYPCIILWGFGKYGLSSIVLYIFHTLFKSFLMSHMVKMRSFKYLNQLAQSQRNSLVQAQETSYRESVRWKLRSVNQLALSDPCFLPHLPHEKALTSSTVNSSFKMTNKMSLRTTINPEGDGVSVRSSEEQMSHQSAEKRYSRDSINQRSSKVEEQPKSKQYCFDCDQIVQQTEDHQCPCHFAVLQEINKRLKDLCITITSNKCEKLIILSENSCKISQSNHMTLLVSFLRHSSVYYSAFEMFLRKRLINLCCKKLALLLEEEDRQ